MDYAKKIGELEEKRGELECDLKKLQLEIAAIQSKLSAADISEQQGEAFRRDIDRSAQKEHDIHNHRHRQSDHRVCQPSPAKSERRASAT